MKKHIIALITVLALLVAVIPMQALASTDIFPAITINGSASTATIEKGGAGRVSLTIEPSRRSTERCAVVYVNSNNETVGENVYTLENTTARNRTLTVTIDTVGLNLEAGTYKVNFWIESKNPSTNRYDSAPEDQIKTYTFNVVSSTCGTNHQLKKTSELKATCSSMGVIKYTCTECGHVVCEETETTDHEYKFDSTWPYTVLPTSSTAGEGRYVCVTCPESNPASKVVIIPSSAVVKITSHPKDVAAASGTSVRFTVVATGDGLTYEWYCVESGATEPTLVGSGKDYITVTNQLSKHENRYYCVVTDEFGNEEVSKEATLRVTGIASIKTQPTDAWAYDGQKATVSVTATGEELEYAWYFKDQGDSDFTKSSIDTATYSVTMNAERDGRQVYCVVTAKNGTTATSDTVTLDTRYAAKITAHPADVTALEDDTVVFTVVATGEGPLEYRWYYKNKNASSWTETECTTAVYSTQLTEDRDGCQVYCKVKDKFGNTISSDTATMEIVAVKITKQPENTTASMGDMATFSVEAEGVGVKYQWQYRNAGTTEWKTSVNTESIYTLEMTEARHGRQVRCIVTDKYGKSETSKSATMKLTAVQIAVQPADVIASVDEAVTFTVQATGDGPLKYQWYYRNAGSSSWTKSANTTDTYTTTMTLARNGRQVYCKVTDVYGNSVKSDTAKMKGPAAEITQQPQDVTVAEGTNATFTVVATGEGPLKYQWYYRNAGTSTWKKSSRTSANYTIEMTEERDGRQVYCEVTDAYGNKVDSDVAKMSAIPTPLEIVTQPSDVTAARGTSAKFSVKATGKGLTYQWYYRNAGASTWKEGSSTTNSYAFDAKEERDGREVYCEITDAYGSTVKTNTVKLTVKVTPLEIITQPSDVTASDGSSATVSVKAAGDGLTYQWYYRNAGSSTWKEGSSTSSSYTFTAKEERNGRELYCEIKDAYGNTVKTNTVKLSVKVTPLEIVTQPSDVTAHDGESVTVSVKATGDGLTYQWYYKNAGADSWKAASSTSSKYTFSVTTARDGRQIYCKIKDANGQTAKSRALTVTVE